MTICVNCGEEGPHFAPPCLGDPGFFICKQKHKQGDTYKMKVGDNLAYYTGSEFILNTVGVGKVKLREEDIDFTKQVPSYDMVWSKTTKEETNSDSD